MPLLPSPPPLQAAERTSLLQALSTSLQVDLAAADPLLSNMAVRQLRHQFWSFPTHFSAQNTIKILSNTEQAVCGVVPPPPPPRAVQHRSTKCPCMLVGCADRYLQSDVVSDARWCAGLPSPGLAGPDGRPAVAVPVQRERCECASRGWCLRWCLKGFTCPARPS